jgi:DNA modification methylase
MPPQLDFNGQNTLKGTHGLHTYAAKCPPQLVRYGLRYYSKPGATVLDPMAGSGTTLVEAKLLGRRALGFDIDPMARLITEVKCSELDDKEIDCYAVELITRLKETTDRKPLLLPPAVEQDATPNGPRPVDWFSPAVAQSLARLVLGIEGLDARPAIKNFFWVGFSSLILARTSVANARDIIHSRHHRFTHAREPDVVERFNQRIRHMRCRMKEFVALCRQVGASTMDTCVRLGDARELPREDSSVDLVFTSPPYATALDYPRAHFLAVAWMQPVLGINLTEYLAQGARYIGSARGRLDNGPFSLDPALAQHGICRYILDGLATSAPRQAKLVQRYFLDMAKVLAETVRVLRPRGHAILVVCPSHIRKVPIATEAVLVELARAVGLRIKAQHTRTIDCRRRLLPYMDGHQLGARMSKEYVLVFQKR